MKKYNWDIPKLKKSAKALSDYENTLFDKEFAKKLFELIYLFNLTNKKFTFENFCEWLQEKISHFKPL